MFAVSAELPLPLEPVPDAVGEVGDNKAEDKAEDEEKIDNEDDGSDFPGVYKDQDDDEDPDNIFIPMNGNFPEDEDDGSYDDSNQAVGSNGSGEAQNSGTFFFLSVCICLFLICCYCVFY